MTDHGRKWHEEQAFDLMDMVDDQEGHGNRGLTWGTRRANFGLALEGLPTWEPGDMEDDIGGHRDRGLT